ncbi:MAG: hypothetical protein AAFY19_05360 [Pseudomonadota bacterium]
MRMIYALALYVVLTACSAPDDRPAPDHEEQGHEARDKDTPGGPGLPLVPDIADEADGEEDIAEESMAAQIPASFRGA